MQRSLIDRLTAMSRVTSSSESESTPATRQLMIDSASTPKSRRKLCSLKRAEQRIRSRCAIANACGLDATGQLFLPIEWKVKNQVRPHLIKLRHR